MTPLLAARLQMALSLGFHIIFAAIGIAMPFLMAISYFLYLKSKNPLDRLLTKTWSQGVALFFAVGAVSGTLLSFELGLLWPKFMEVAGPIIGMPFSLEGAAFFLEAIALGVFLYGWDRVPAWTHWASGLLVGVMGVTSGLFVVCANAWMNSPAGFDWNNGNPTNIDPIAAMFNPSALVQGIHMIIAAFEAVGFAVAGVHAILWLKTKYPIHLRALKIALSVGAIAALIQPLSGDFSAKSVARRQPAKLAAMEAHYETEAYAPLILGGLPNDQKEETEFAIRIPGLLSFLAHGDPSQIVTGLKDIPKDHRPPTLVTHFAFQVMILFGSFLALVGGVFLVSLWKKPRFIENHRFIKLVAFATPLGFLALEAGWIVTEVGRQPWIIYETLRTAEALTPRPGTQMTLLIYGLIYFFLTGVILLLMSRQVKWLHREIKKGGSF